MPPLPPTRPAWFYHLMALTTTTIWSFSFLFIVRINEYLSPIGVVVVRKDISLPLVLLLLLWRRPNIARLTGRQWAILVGLGLVGGPLYHLVFAWSAGQNVNGESRIDPGLLGLILATVPVHTGWLGWLFLKERLSAARVVALGLGLAGVTTVLAGRYGRIDLLPREHLEGPVAATVAAMLGGGIAVLTRAGRTVFGPFDLVAVAGLLIVLFVAPFHAWADLHRVADMDAGGWTAVGFLGVFGSFVAFITWATALRRLRAVTAAMYLFLSSVLAALWGRIFNDTPIGWPFFAGAALVLAGLLLMARAGRSPAPPPACRGRSGGGS